ncbi:MAG: helix-turn-helix transcriptional regulator [Firmicutes bacterium]|nr:helix-turn-helix transcriptional regulator [Bacillota bacterium]
MDNIKTGTLIKELRKEKDLTQLDLAKALHVTDRAVSKWERGICAPDIGLLEPLSALLGVTVTELIAGERFEEKPAAAVEENVQKAIDYSGKELTEKTRKLKEIYLEIAVVIILLLAITCAILWWKGVFNITGRYESPDGNNVVTVYNRDITGLGEKDRPAITVKRKGKRIVRDDITYSTTILPCKNFEQVLWSPDSSKYIVSVDTEESGVFHIIVNMKTAVGANLSGYIWLAMQESSLTEAIPFIKDGEYNTEAQSGFNCRILQWSADSKSVLINYTYSDENQQNEGYFWFNTETEKIEGVMKMELEKSNEEMNKEMYEEYKKLKIDGSLIGLESGDEEGGYFCTPIGMKVIGWETGGIHYGMVPEYGDMIFAVNPMSCVDDYVYPVAENFVDFMRLILACESTTAIEQIVWWDKAQFEDFLGNEEYNVRTPERTAALEKIASELGITPMENPFEYVKELQAGFNGSKLRFDEEEEEEWTQSDQVSIAISKATNTK